jgi:hypothetical protein
MTNATKTTAAVAALAKGVGFVRFAAVAARVDFYLENSEADTVADRTKLTLTTTTMIKTKWIWINSLLVLLLLNLN